MNLVIRGIVLKETAYGEGDKVLTVLAEDYGKIQIWARGARKTKSALLAASHLLNFSEFTVAEKAGAFYCNGANVIESHFKLRSDLEKLTLAGYFADLVNNVVQDGQTDNDVLHLLMNALYLLTYSEKTQAHIKAVFELRLMSVSGFAPELHRCVQCGAGQDRITGFSFSGGTVCADCDSAAVPISGAIYKAMVFVTEEDAKNIFSFVLTPDVQKQFSEICEKYVIYHIGVPLKSLAFYKSLLEGFDELK